MSYYDIEVCIRDADSNEVVKTLLEECIMVKFGQKLQIWVDDKVIHSIEEYLPRMSPSRTRMFVDIREYEELLEYKRQKEAEKCD